MNKKGGKKVPFNEECEYLDKTQMSRPVIYHKTSKGIEPVVGTVHYICQKEDNFGWISKCPDECP